MSRHDVLAEFTRGTVTQYYDTDAMADEIVRFRGERDALRQQLAVVGVAAHGGDISDVPSNYRTDTSDKVVKLARILAALREPSETVISKVWEEIIVQCTLQTHDPKSGKPLKDWICHEVTEKEVPLVIRAAVEAAEQEASA
jgi:hypothetical protein